ncbi:hypothetical protein VNI00_010511 [Paramarasmius palmivorus]|uniref:F-box domain-containing protein n=1 Tax=Paramarasmius palmivorus TaxID=297713 RepID=A0AAW0CKD3_9AGAR
MVPTSKFLHTNYTPAPEELNDVRSLLHDSEEELRSLEEQITQLEARRKELKEFINHHRALLSSARRIPREVLEQIFIHCLPTDYFPLCSASEPPLIFTTICRKWREIAISTPHLWKAIHISLPPAFRPEMNDILTPIIEQRQQGIQQWLKRSGCLPISFSLFAGTWYAGLGTEMLMLSPSSGNPVLNMYRPFIDMLVGYSSRWEHASFSRLPPSILEVLGTQQESAVPQLRVLHLDLANGDSGPLDNVASLSNLIGLPTMQSLHLHGHSGSPLQYPVRWENLADLQLTRPVGSVGGIVYQDIALEILSRCSQRLKSVTLDIRPRRVVYVGPDLEFPHLLELDLQFYNYTRTWLFPGDVPGGEEVLDVMKTFFDAINAPALVHLGIKVDAGLKLPWTYDPPPFMSFIRRCKCDLRYLSLCMPLYDQVFLDCLPFMPSLAVLKLVEHRLDEVEHANGYLDPGSVSSQTITELLVQALASPSTPAFPGCQKLEKVHLISVSPSMAEPLYRLSRDRERPFRSFDVDFCDFLQGVKRKEVSSWLKELRRHGTVVRWRSPVSQPSKVKGNAREGLLPSACLFNDVVLDPNTEQRLEVVY